MKKIMLLGIASLIALSGCTKGDDNQTNNNNENKENVVVEESTQDTVVTAAPLEKGENFFPSETFASKYTLYPRLEGETEQTQIKYLITLIAEKGYTFIIDSNDILVNVFHEDEEGLHMYQGRDLEMSYMNVFTEDKEDIFFGKMLENFEEVKKDVQKITLFTYPSKEGDEFKSGDWTSRILTVNDTIALNDETMDGVVKLNVENNEEGINVFLLLKEGKGLVGFENPNYSLRLIEQIKEYSFPDIINEERETQLYTN